jgi:alpha-L-fucosidase
MNLIIKYLLTFFFPLILLNFISCSQAEKSDKDKRMQWFRDAKFGLFIHWGLYAIPAGEWEGKIYPGISEWIMYKAQITVEEYRQLAKEFNPVKFNADEWVKLAKDAGMKYVVITSKHHDGFAMYHSKASSYNIVDATPFKRDPVKELSEACQKYDLKFGFYYSQTQDWNEPNGAGNDWDFDGDSPKNFRQYLDEKVIPQVREICTNYGPISILWFDTPRFMTPEQSKELADLVHELQPDCLIDGRIGNNMGDFETKGDNKLPTGATSMDWDTPATMNHSWGYKKSDENWKSPSQLIRAVVEVASKGGTYLLNVGPTAEGLIPQPSIDRLLEVGKWIKINEEALYGTRMSPFTIDPSWGEITQKPGKLFLHVFEWPENGKLELYGLQNKVLKASLLADKKELTFKQNEDQSLNHQTLIIDIPAVPSDTVITVVALDIEGEASADNEIVQQSDGIINLYGIQADLHKSEENSLIKKDDIGIQGWLNTGESASWDFTVLKAGTFEIDLGSYEIKKGSGRNRRAIYEGGHILSISINGEEIKFTTGIQKNHIENPSPYFQDIVSTGGNVTISKPGKYSLKLKPISIVTKEEMGLTLRWIRLKPVEYF